MAPNEPDFFMTPPPFVISIQSQVVFGHVGNSAALFPMQAAGLEVAAIPTVIFSNTPDYPTLRGRALDPDLFADLLLGAQERGLPQRADYILTGYIGSVEVARKAAELGADVAGTQVANRVAYAETLGRGLGVAERARNGVARDEMAALTDEVLAAFG